MQNFFRRFASRASDVMGAPWTFALSLSIVVLWLMIGPMCHYSDSWQLWINTGTSIAAFLMVFLIQNTQNRDARAIHLKLDELIRSNSEARNAVINLQSRSDEEMGELAEELAALVEEPCADASEPGEPSDETRPIFPPPPSQA